MNKTHFLTIVLATCLVSTLAMVGCESVVSFMGVPGAAAPGADDGSDTVLTISGTVDSVAKDGESFEFESNELTPDLGMPSDVATVAYDDAGGLTPGEAIFVKTSKSAVSGDTINAVDSVKKVQGSGTADQAINDVYVSGEVMAVNPQNDTFTLRSSQFMKGLRLKNDVATVTFGSIDQLKPGDQVTIAFTPADIERNGTDYTIYPSSMASMAVTPAR